jgi:tetratricopeptide (TPR) repeat protein
MATPETQPAPAPGLWTHASGRRADLSVVAPAAAAAVLLFAAVEFHGAFLVRHWGPVAIFALIVLATRGARPADGATAALVVTAWSYGAWSLASAAWGASPESGVEGGLRNLFYAGLLTLPLVACNTRAAALTVAKVVMAGLGLAVAATVAELAATGTETMVAGRLSEPIGYPNGTASLMALAAVALVCVSAGRTDTVSVRAASYSLAVMALALAFLTQSRGVIVGFAGAAVAAICLGPDRLRRASLLAAATGCVAIGSAALMAPFDSFLAERVASPDSVEKATWVVLGLGAGSALLMLAFAVFDRGLRPKTAFRPLAPRVRTAGVLAVLAVAIAGAGAAVGDPIDAIGGRVDEFRALEPAGSPGARLGSTGGQRADLWRIALDEFAGAPLIGVGEGSYAEGYYEQRRTDRNLTNPHSFPLAVLAETGLVGLALIMLAGVLAVRVLVQRWRLADALARRRAAALIAAAVAVLAQATVDWLWAIPGLMGIAIFCLGLAIAVLANPAAQAPRGRTARTIDGALRVVAVGAAIAVAGLVLSDSYVRASSASRDGSAAEQLRFARRAHTFNPLALRPRYLASGALERLGRRDQARRELLAALDREPRNFATLAALGDLELRAGRARTARAWYSRALRLNPRDAGLRRLAR